MKRFVLEFAKSKLKSGKFTEYVIKWEVGIRMSGVDFSQKIKKEQ